MEQRIKIKCPHCGWIRNLDKRTYEETVVASVTRDIREDILKLIQTTKSSFTMDSLDEANAWVDILCAHCNKTYQHNAKTGEVRR
jgi:phage FluMu protein Com